MHVVFAKLRLLLDRNFNWESQKTQSFCPLLCTSASTAHNSCKYSIGKSFGFGWGGYEIMAVAFYSVFLSQMKFQIPITCVCGEVSLTLPREILVCFLRS